MKNWRNENYIALLAMLLLGVGTASAEGFNPLLPKNHVREKDLVQKAKVSALVKSSHLPPALPLPPPPVIGGSPIPTGIPSIQAQAKTVWQVVGMVNGQVTIASNAGQMTIVQNGTVRDGCLVEYPDIVCDPAEIGATRQKRAAAIPSQQHQPTVAAGSTKETGAAEKATMEKTISDLKQQLSERLQTTEKLEEAQQTIDRLRVTESEYGKLKADFAILQKDLESKNVVIASQAKALGEANKSVEVALNDLKVRTRELSLEREASARLQREGSDAHRESAVMKKENDVLRKELAVKTRDNAVLASRVESLLKENGRAQMAGSRANESQVLSQSPPWVKGFMTDYQDSRLGIIGLVEGEQEVCFRVSGKAEDTADSLFGGNVFRKEKSGRYVYYAIDKRAVNIRRM